MREEGGMTRVEVKASYSDAELADTQRQYKWEKGQIDYTGELFLCAYSSVA